MLVEVTKIAYNHFQLLSIMMSFPIKVSLQALNFTWLHVRPRVPLHVRVNKHDKTDYFQDRLSPCCKHVLSLTHFFVDFAAVVACFSRPQWPQSLYDSFSVMSAMSAAGGQILSPDCLLNGGVSNIATDFGSKLYVQGIAVGLLPIVCILTIALFWQMRSCISSVSRRAKRACRRCCNCYKNLRNRRHSAVVPNPKLTAKEARQKTRVGIVLLLFVTHLMLVQTALDFFVCRKVNI